MSDHRVFLQPLILARRTGLLGGRNAGAPDSSHFFLLHTAKVPSAHEEGPGQIALQSACHNPQLDATELKQTNYLVNAGQKLQKTN